MFFLSTANPYIPYMILVGVIWVMSVIQQENSLSGLVSNTLIYSETEQADFEFENVIANFPEVEQTAVLQTVVQASNDTILHQKLYSLEASPVLWDSFRNQINDRAPPSVI